MTNNIIYDVDIQHLISGLEFPLHKYVFLRKDTQGLYIEPVFIKNNIYLSRCLSKYTKDCIIDNIYILSSFTCNHDSGCDIGKPLERCKGMTYFDNWSIENPQKCGCWLLNDLTISDKKSIEDILKIKQINIKYI